MKKILLGLSLSLLASGVWAEGPGSFAGLTAEQLFNELDKKHTASEEADLVLAIYDKAPKMYTKAELAEYALQGEQNHLQEIARTKGWKNKLQSDIDATVALGEKTIEKILSQLTPSEEANLAKLSNKERADVLGKKGKAKILLNELLDTIKDLQQIDKGSDSSSDMQDKLVTAKSSLNKILTRLK